MSLVGRFVRRVHRDGLSATLRSAWSALMPETLGLYRLERLTAPNGGAGTEIHRGVDALLRLRRHNNLLPDEFYCDGRPGFVDCICVTLDQALAGVIWVLRGRDASRYISLQDGQAELSYLHVVAWARGRGLAKQLYWRAASECLAQGVKEVFAVIAAENYASRRAAEAVGFWKIAELRRSALWGRKFTIPSPATPASRRP